MEIKGKVVATLALETGVSNAGKEWFKQTFVIEEPYIQYPKNVAFQCMNKALIDAVVSKLQIDEVITVHFNVSSREYNGKWYSQIDAWKIDREAVSSQAPVAVVVVSEPTSTDDDTLPF